MKASDPDSIQKTFNALARSYDRTNTILSFGIHKIWKKKLIYSKPFPARGSLVCLDLACGTGDLAFILEKALDKKIASIQGLDFSVQMLDLAKKKAKSLGSKVIFQEADILNLPIQDQSVDLITLSFGLRNTSDLAQVFRECARVLRPLGQLRILEFGSKSDAQGFMKLYERFARVYLPFVGGLCSGQKKAYQYLQESSERFPSGEKILTLAQKEAAFSSSSFQVFSFGICYFYYFEK